ncbi:MAG: Ger(x)C family spore germination protein [Syntrophomonadaceae bacterium]|nr:Ger(x)C family spore germination protein [Syntrophomonadaceae bacterium]MDD4548676.1 Ger(x)C family spore germination protein [Syntrophomonadaceae bacterium]
MLYKIAKYKKLLSLLIIIFLGVTLTGCWDHRELDQLAIVAGLAFDKHPENKVWLTTQIINPGAAGSSASDGGGGGEIPYWNLSSIGENVFDAVRNANHDSPRRLFFAHNYTVIMSEELARSGIQNYFDWYMRDAETRSTVWVLISEKNARDVLSTQPKLAKIPGLYINELFTNTAAVSMSPKVNMKDFVQRVLSDTTAPIAPLVHVMKHGQEKSPGLIGTAVFNKELKMVGKLNGIETRGMLWVLGEVKSGIITVKAPNFKENAALEILNAKSSIKPLIEGNNIKIIIKVRVESNLGEINSPVDLMLPQTWDTLSNYQAAAIRKEIQLALKKSHELNADIFGFGDMIYKKYPREWKEMKDRWEDIYPGLEVEIIVESKLRRPGLLQDTIKAIKAK